MITSIADWMAFLHSCDALTGLPFIFAGLAMMLLGWRMWKFAVVLTFTLLGLSVGLALADTPENQSWYGLGGAIVLGVASFPPVERSVTLLGGLIGAGVVSVVLESAGIHDTALWVARVLCVLVITPLCAVNRKQVIIVITAVQGAVLLISGLAILAHREPNLRGTYEDMCQASAIVGPFVLLVPTMVSVFLQMADVRQKERGG